MTDLPQQIDQIDHVTSWYGFGSPVGLGILIVSIALAAALIRFAFTGWNG